MYANTFLDELFLKNTNLIKVKSNITENFRKVRYGTSDGLLFQ